MVYYLFILCGVFIDLADSIMEYCTKKFNVKLFTLL